MELDQEKIKSILFYKESDGTFYWKDLKKRGVRLDGKAGNKVNGYIRIRIDGVAYAAHRLAWLYIYGKFPDFEIDHINRIRDDNRICNLRDVTHEINLMNKGANNSSKFFGIGVYLREKNKSWIASIKLNKKQYHLGYFKNKDDAINARIKAEEIFDKGGM